MKLTISTAAPYDIYVERGVLQKAGERIRAVLPKGKAAIITDDRVAPFYLRQLEAALDAAGIPHCSLIFPNGEHSKNHQTLIQIYDFLCDHELTRSDFLIALGGGVVGDITGFAAATFQRGVPYVQIPTTFLAQIDSSVGGKTAVDTSRGKNLVGCFWQPSLVLCDIDTLDTLTDEIYKDGIAEGIKYGLIWDEKLFDCFREGRLKAELEQVICRCIEIKRDVVQQDERDTGLRMILNFGHTVGHAIEKELNFEITHGKAVALGMAVITKACCARGLCPPDVAEKTLAALETYGIPSEIDLDFEAVCQKAMGDKKRSGNTVSVIILNRIGQAAIQKMTAQELRDFVFDGLSD